MGVVNAEPILDQSNVLAPNTDHAVVLGYSFKAVQSFQPSRSSNISLVQVPLTWFDYVYPPVGNAEEIIMQIQTDSGGIPSGQMVSSNCYAIIPGFTVPAFPSYNWFDFSIGNNCFLDANITYWMVLSSPNSSQRETYLVFLSPANNYINGVAKYYEIDGTWHDLPGNDFLFREYTEPIIACSVNANCGTDSWVEGPVCQEGNAFQDYRVYTCNEPGTPASFCTETDSFFLKQVCANSTPYCENGECVSSEPLDQRVFILEQQVQDLTNQNNELNERVGILETNDQTQDTKISAIEIAIESINTLVSELQTTLMSFVDKITSYLTNLDFKTKSDMLCGYMENEELNNYTDLGITCKIVNDKCKCTE